MSDDRVDVGWEFNCPFCVGKFFIPAGPPMVLHSLPPCPDYIQKEALDFLVEVNNTLGVKRD
jgi:hypothetical protein